jgi:excisionase family DNA binding protein
MDVTLLTVGEVAEALRVSRATAYRLIRNGGLPSIRVGGGYRVARHDLLAYLQAGRANGRA